jgi:hypothetical protein
MNQRVSLGRQIAAVNLAIKTARRASAKTLGMNQAAVDLYLGDLMTAAETLAWLERNQSAVKTAREAEAKKTEVAAP